MEAIEFPDWVAWLGRSGLPERQREEIIKDDADQEPLWGSGGGGVRQDGLASRAFGTTASNGDGIVEP